MKTVDRLSSSDQRTSDKTQLGIHLSNDVIYDSSRQMLSVAKGFNTGFNSVQKELDLLKTKVFDTDRIQRGTEGIRFVKDKSFRYRRNLNW